MPQKANILIPDISGYTEFLTRTELEHSSHILNELLSILVDSNRSDLTLLEIEGDALLFYRKGDPMTFDQMVGQCVEMFRNFHTRLRVIERDSVCQCGACQTVSNLTLKFVVHYGEVSEISVSTFVKASGINMVIAHRLMKNRIASNEYILATEQYCAQIADHASAHPLTWESSSEEYPVVGVIPFRYALLDRFKVSIPIPERPPVAVTLGGEMLTAEINAPMQTVYEVLTNLNTRSRWIAGLKGSSSNDPLDRLYSTHYCHFDDFTFEIVPLQREIEKDRIRYSESGGPSGGERVLLAFELTRKADDRTLVELQIGSNSASPLPKETAAAMHEQMRGTLASFKSFLEQE